MMILRTVVALVLGISLPPLASNGPAALVRPMELWP